MESIKIPDTDLVLSPIGLGTVNAGLAWDKQDAFQIFEAYLETGGNVIDTAHVYSDWVPGESARAERVLGDWIRQRRKTNDFILMTKGGHPKSHTMDISRLSRQEMEDDLNSSLDKLGVDCIDIYFYHRDDLKRTVDELIETMEYFRRLGKIRYYGCSNWTVARMREADTYCKKMGYRGFVANQAMYNIGVNHMKPFPDPTMVVCDKEMLAYHSETNNLLIPYMGVCSGFYHLMLEKGIGSVSDSCYYTDANLSIGKKLYTLCKIRDYTVTQALTGFFGTQNIPMLPLMSADSMEQLEEILKAMKLEFNPEDYSFTN